MASLAPLLLAVCALALARAATIPEHAVLTRSIPDHIEEASPLVSTPEESQNGALKVSALRSEPVEVIPVEVVVENIDPSVKSNEVADDDDLKRAPVDISNPGPPQRQEHETQNPEHYSEDKLRLETIKENIEQTRVLLKQGFQGVTDDIQNWNSVNDQSKIQSNIQNFRTTFVAQIKKLDDALHALAKPPQDDSEDSDSQKLAKEKIKSDFQKIESRLKVFQDNFSNGLVTLYEGVNLVGMLKSGQIQTGRQDPAAPAPAPAQPSQPAQPTQPQNVLGQYWAQFSGFIGESFANITAPLVNLVGGQSQSPPPAGVQSDTGDTTTNRPFQWTLPSRPVATVIGNLISSVANNFNQPQQGAAQGEQDTAAASGPLSGVQQIWTQITNPFRPPAAAPTEGVSASSENKPVQAAPAVSQTIKKPEEQAQLADQSAVAPAPQPTSQPAPQPDPQPAPQPASQPAPQSAQLASPPAPEGPIRQMLTNNPVAQGIAGAVQRITNSITNPERPRETEEKKDPATKGGHGRPPPNGSGANNSDSGLSEPVKEIKVPLADEPQKTEVSEAKPDVLADKTE